MKEPLMIGEIFEQPEALERTAAAVAKFTAGGLPLLRPEDTVHLAGCGDMHFSALAAAALFRTAFPKAPFRVEAHESMAMRWDAARIRKGDVTITASFSGRTPRTVEAALLARRAGARVIGITGNAPSPFSESLDRVLLLHTGPAEELGRHPYGGYHANVPQTKTFTAALFAELLLLARLAERAGISGEEGGAAALAQWSSHLDGIPPFLDSLLPPLRGDVASFISSSFDGRSNIVVLGSGPWRPAAMYGAAKFLEMAVPSRHQCIEEFNHLELFVTASESLVVFVCPDEPSLQRAEELAGLYSPLGCRRLILDARKGKNPEKGIDRICLPHAASPGLFFAFAAALQLLAAGIGPALSRNIDRWVGGVRTELIENLSLSTIRGSRIMAP